MKVSLSIIYLILAFCVHGQNLVLHIKCNLEPIDNSSYGNNGQIIGGVTSTADRFGNQCGAFNFNGTDGYIEIPSSSSLEKITKKMSATFWYKIKDPNDFTALNWLTIFCKGLEPVETASNPQFRFQTFQSNKQSTISINSEFTEFDLDFQNHLFQFDKWCFYTVTWDGNMVECYINSTKIWEFPYQATLTANQDPLHIGKDIPGSTEFFIGDLDDLRIYDGKLSIQKINELYNDQTDAELEDDYTLKFPQDIKKTTDYGRCYANITYKEPIVIENCGFTTLKRLSSLKSGDNFPIGITNVKYEAINNYGLKKTCSFKVIVENQEKIEITCQNDTTIYIENDSLKTFTYFKPQVIINCTASTIKLVSGIESGNIFPIGNTENVFMVTSQNGETATCSFNVNVINKKTIKDTAIVINSKIPHKTKEYEALKFKSQEITILIYDNLEEDNDTISIFYNNKEIVSKEMIRLRKNSPTIKHLQLDEYPQNEFIIKAWNVGKIPPNTLKIEFYEGNIEDKYILKGKIKPFLEKIYSSDPKTGAKIMLNKL